MTVNLEEYLLRNFGFTEFKSGQKEVITSLLNQHNTLAVLPTGGGKSLIYQLIGKLTGKPVLIVSPLISLMQDQVTRLQAQAVKRVVAITSTLTYFEKQRILKNLHDYDYIFISPEMLNTPIVLERVRSLKLGLLVVDEAHCISQWGPDFRPDYLEIKKIRQQLQKPLTLMLTATANKATQTDIIEKLGFTEKQVYKVISSVNRENIFLSCKQLADQQSKDEWLIKLVNQLTGAGIIYFYSKKQAEAISQLLTAKTKRTVMAYHADLDSSTRFKIQQQFMNDQIDVVCATSAFGMGIDKDNIRYVIHYHLADSLANYVQEIGRAGRDGQLSLAVLLYEPGDWYLQQHLITKTLPSDPEIQTYLALNQATDEGKKRLLEYYTKNHYSQSAMSELFKNRKRVKLTELQTMLKYINADCKRAQITNYFDQKEHPQAICCDFHNEFWNDWQQFSKQYLTVDSKTTAAPVINEADWIEIINQLFL